MIINQIASGGGGGLDTYDATAYPEHILTDYTAYARGAKLTGTYEPPKYLRFKNHMAMSDPSCPAASSFSIVIPTDTQDGDLIICNVMHKDTVTPPSGFILVASQLISNFTQYGSIYYKICDGDAGTTVVFNQASSQRIGIETIIAECNGTAIVDVYNTSTNTAAPITFPAVSATKDGCLCVFLTTSVYTSNVITLSGASWITFNITSDVQRIAVATKHVNIGSVSALTITQTNSSSVCSIAVVFKAT